jgi:tRNA (adenine57-N1/adenine58-N1)-methyltransferase
MDQENLNSSQNYAQAGDLVQLIGPGEENITVLLEASGQLHTHIGVIKHEDLVGKEWGSQIHTHLEKPFVIVKPALDDLLRDIKRTTQILYPKDIGYILVNMGIGPGTHVVEAGTGSGALTTAFAHTVGPQGRVTTYEKRPENQKLAQSNLEFLGLSDRVVFKVRDIAEGFDEKNVEALFLDLPDPDRYIPQVREALMPGGFFGAILPTTNQVSLLLKALKDNHFAFMEVSEILHRYYKPIANRLRPVDRMTGHTGYLIFARPISGDRSTSEDS